MPIKLPLKLLAFRCVLCDALSQDDMDLCSDCEADLPRLAAGCAICADPHVTYDGLCARCALNPPSFDRIFAPYHYIGDMEALIKGLKFAQRFTHGRILGILLGRFLHDSDVPRPDLLMPVPLHYSRLRERGFNQSLEISRWLQNPLKVKLKTTYLARDRATANQSTLNAKERWCNLVGAFSCTGDLSGRRIALVDDVVTTTATVHELATVLKAAGAARVDVWTPARATYSNDDIN